MFFLDGKTELIGVELSYILSYSAVEVILKLVGVHGPVPRHIVYGPYDMGYTYLGFTCMRNTFMGYGSVAGNLTLTKVFLNAPCQSAEVLLFVFESYVSTNQRALCIIFKKNRKKHHC